MRFIVFCFLFVITGYLAGYAQEDTTVRPAPRIITPAQPGSMQVTDMNGRKANVIVASSNNLSNRTVIHLIDNYLKYTY